MKPLVSGIEIFSGRGDIDGLQECRLRRFGEVVVLAGANGSGKTRLLNAIQSSLEFAKVISLKKGDHNGNYSTYVGNLKREAEEYRRASLKSESPAIKDEAEANLRRVDRLLARHLGIEFHAGVRPAEIDVVNVSPPQVFEFRDPDQLSHAEMRRLLDAQVDPFVRLSHPEDTLLHIQSLIDQYFRVSSLDSMLTPDSGQSSIEASYFQLQGLVSQFTGASLEADRKNFRAVLGGQSLFEGSRRLSLGQRWLLALSASVMSGGLSDGKLLIQLDEPELFLHPAALVKVLTAMRERWQSSQFIIATHSVPLIANLGFENVYWMYKGKAEYGGRKTSDVLSDLLGGGDNIEQLQSLTLEPSRLATLTFAVECLFPPSVAGPQANDPQREQLEAVVNRRILKGGVLRLLDWGAGKARLLTCLAQDTKIDVAALVDYVAYEPNEATALEASSAIALVYGTAEARCYDDVQLISQRYGAFFNVVVLCNVLHEIHPSKWEGMFATIKNFLDEKGQLLIIEDAALPHGELAHHDGFVIVDALALKELFGLPYSPSEILPREEYVGRLFAFSLRKADLNLSRESIIACMKHVKSRSKNAIDAARSAAVDRNPTFIDGTLFALHLAQFVNADLVAARLDCTDGNTPIE